MDFEGECELTYQWKNRSRCVSGKIIYDVAVLVEGQHEAWHSQTVPDADIPDNVGMSKLVPRLLTRSKILRDYS